jgi:UDP-N-acetylglucosamine 4,6-dehydratase/5-epimerase
MNTAIGEISNAKLAGSTILITGGTGSFGNELLKSINLQDVSEVRIFSRDELKQDEMRRKLSSEKVRFYVGDVRDPGSIKNAMVGADFVFHAAALKQVPSCEFFPMQAVATNIEGSNNVLNAAIDAKVKSVVCLSTDKAVQPINAMGITKAAMEKVARSLAHRAADSGTTISIVRYGNVMYSRGSVLPYFVSQLRAGQPLTITAPDMTRFLLSLQDAIELVKFAFARGEPGDILIKKSPAATVLTTAQALASIFGAELQTKIIGTRHGEKEHETLATREEIASSVEEDQYFRCRMDRRSINYDAYVGESQKQKNGVDDFTSANTTRLSVEETVTLFRGLRDIQNAFTPISERN